MSYKQNTSYFLSNFYLDEQNFTKILTKMDGPGPLDPLKGDDTYDYYKSNLFDPKVVHIQSLK